MAFWSNRQPLEQRQTNNDIITLKLIRGFAEFYVKIKFSKSEVLIAIDKSISVSVRELVESYLWGPRDIVFFNELFIF